MSCLVHDAHYRSSFHAVVNELRNEKRIPVPILRTMPHKCCTCNDDNNNLTPVTVPIHDTENLIKLKFLIDRIDREKQNNPKLILALNHLEIFFKENRQLKDSVPSKLEENIPMDTGMKSVRNKTKQQKKPAKPVNNGAFLFLPYKSEKSDSLLDVAKTMLRSRFIGRDGYIAELEKQYTVCINMITPKTTGQVTDALVIAKNGKGNVKIHKGKDRLEGDENGEWVLVRPKKVANQPKTTDFADILDELTDRWESCLKIRKRRHEKDDDEEDDEECPNKK